ncbi:unnamed protein product [Effrenium voratum]|uniref:Uncharacterized protein n=1 Tax=Effrenium voratum TaxID=2562239 RepID=A0AA36HNT4_9DINO|nr:unnamed protein product [Effrenium voratum]
MPVAPYGVLHLFIDRASGLPAADVTGFSDPYVTAQVDDKDLDLRTSTQSTTLAPRWGEDFCLSIYRPESVLTLLVHDEDFGNEASLGFAGSLVGLSDDLLGYVDIAVARLPLNTRLSGWFDLYEVSKPVNSYTSRAAKMQSGEKPRKVGRIRLQLTLRAQPQHELFAFCLGPPSFGEPLQPLDLASLLRNITVIAHEAQLAERFWSPLLEHAERGSSAICGTGILLLWRPEFILPLLILLACGILLNASPAEEEEGAAAAVESDPALQNVFKAAEAHLPQHQYTEMCAVQGSLNLAVEVIQGWREVWAWAVCHKQKVSLCLAFVAAVLVYHSEWQGLVLRLALTALLAVAALQHSSLWRILRGVAIYRRGKLPLKDWDGLLGYATERVQDTRSLTPEEAQSLSNSPVGADNSEGSAKNPPSLHVMEESSWTEPKWCQHCGGFLWGAWRQGWQCRSCGVVLCHACAAESDLDYCAKKSQALGPLGPDRDTRGAVCELDFGLKDSSLHVLVLPSSEAVLEAAAAAITKAKAAGQKVFVSLSLPPEILDSLDQKEASDARRVERHLGGYVDAVKEALKEVDLVWLPYAAFKKQFWAGTQKMLEKKKWAYGVHAEVGQASVAKKLLDRSPRPTAWLTADDLLRPAHEAAVAAALDLGVACVSLPRKAPGSLAELYFRSAGFEAPSSAAAVQHAWHRGMAAVLRGKLVASEVTEASVPAMVNLLTAAAVAADHADRFQGAKAPLEAALNSGRALLGKDATATTKEADAIFPGVTATTLSGLAEQAKVFKGNNHIIYAEDFFNKATFAAIKEETERLWRSKDIEANCNLDGTNRLGGYILDLVPANSSLYRLVYGNDPFRQWVSAVNAEGPMWPADFPIELREYGRESKGMGCHPDLQMYKVPRKDLEFAFTVDNDSRCNVTFWDLAGKQHFVQTKPNSLMMVGVNAATHCVSSTDGGTRSILKFIYVGDYRKSNEFWYYTSNECDDQNPNRQMLADRRAQRSAEVHASEL